MWQRDRTRAFDRLGIALASVVSLACFAEPGDADTDTDTTDGTAGTAGTAGSSGGSAAGSDTSVVTDAPGETGRPDDTSGAATSAPDSSGDDGQDSSTGEPPVCGNGIVDQPSEMCDGSLGCLGDCTFVSYACNPLNNAGCAAGLRCGLDDFAVETFACMPPGASGIGEVCSGLPFNDSACADALTCLWNVNTPKCDEGDCCVPYCSLQDPAPPCSPGTVCSAFFPRPMYQGLEHLGFCGEPF